MSYRNGGIVIKERQLNSKQTLTLKLNNKNSFLIFPFEIVLGYVAQTGAGINKDIYKLHDFSTYQRVFTGMENVIAKWKNAYKVFKKNDNDKFLTKEYSVGEYFRGFAPTNNQETMFVPSTISNDFLAELDQRSFEVHTYTELKQEDIFNFYIIPQLGNEKWLKITSGTNYYSKGVYHHTEIVYSTIENEISKSGEAVNQRIQRGAPGEGYAWPKIVNDGKKVELDTIRNRDIPITDIQIEIGGAAAFLTMPFCWGRPTIEKIDPSGVVEGLFNPKIQAPRILLSYGFNSPQPSPLNTRPVITSDYYLLTDAKATLWTSYNNFKDQFQASWDLTMRAQFQGMLETNSQSNDDIKLTNILSKTTNNGDTHSFTIWNNDWEYIPKKDIYLYSYSNGMTNDKPIILKKNVPIKIRDFMNHTIFSTSSLKTLPVETTQNIPWHIKDLPIVGGFLNHLFLGFSFGWNDSKTGIGINPLAMLVPCDIVDYGNALMGRKGTETCMIGLEAFNGEVNNDQLVYSGLNAMGCALKLNLTDLFEIGIGDDISKDMYVFNTIHLGQDTPKIDDNGKVVPQSWIDKNPKLLWDSTCAAVARKAFGYVIDNTVSKFIGKYDYRLTFFNYLTEVWSGTYQSKSKFSKNIRDIENIHKMSDWKTGDGKKIEYPRAIVKPKPPSHKIKYVVLPIKFSDSISTNLDQNNFDLKDCYTAIPQGGIIEEKYNIVMDDKRIDTIDWPLKSDYHYDPTEAMGQPFNFFYDYFNELSFKLIIGGATKYMKFNTKKLVNAGNTGIDINVLDDMRYGSLDIKSLFSDWDKYSGACSIQFNLNIAIKNVGGKQCIAFRSNGSSVWNWDRGAQTYTNAVKWNKENFTSIDEVSFSVQDFILKV